MGCRQNIPESISSEQARSLCFPRNFATLMAP
jgi:hypothetical protein